MSSVAAAATLASYGKPGRTECLEQITSATAWLNHLQTQHQVGTANYLANSIGAKGA